MALALRAAAACPGPDPGAFAFAILQTQSGFRRNDGKTVWSNRPYVSDHCRNRL